MVYADIESILVTKSNGKQNPDELYTTKYQKIVACIYGFKLACPDGNINKPFF